MDMIPKAKGNRKFVQSVNDEQFARMVVTKSSGRILVPMVQ